MKRFAKNLISDVILWSVVAVYFFAPSLSVAAENLIGFFGVFLLFMGVILSLGYKGVAKKISENKSFTPRAKWHKVYSAVTSVIEIAVMASLGWHWVAAGMVVYAIASAITDEEAESIFKKSHSDEDSK